MNARSLLKTILPGLLPLFVFIAADYVWGTEIGLYVAVVFGLVQMLVIYIKERRLDKFVLFDTLLIVALGIVSIVLNNDIFFKIKPGVIGLILVGILGFSTFSSKNVMMLMSERYLKGIKMNQEQQKMMNRSIRIMFWLFLAHTALVFYSAFFMSKEAWAFISGVLFYIIFGVFILIEFIKNIIKRKGNNREEIIAEIDEEGKLIGKMSRTKAHDDSMKLHPVIHVHILNSKGEVLLQKRSKKKRIQAGKWDTAVGGHISYGEDIKTALVRETQEELGLRELDFKFVTKYIWKSDIERELVFVFAANVEKFDFTPNDEVDEVKFWPFKEIRQNLRKETFTPNFELEFAKILQNIRISK